jgi:hypothetical protein
VTATVSNYISSAGLFLDLMGAALIWKFGLPAEISRTGAQHRITEEIDRAEVATARRFDRISSWGFVALLIGFALQLASNFLGRSTTLQVRTHIDWNTALNDPLTIVFTAVIAGSTVVYTVLTRRLWKTTRNSVDIARYNAFMAYMTALIGQIERMKATDAAAAKLLEAFSSVVAEVAINRFLTEVDFTHDADARNAFTRIADVLRAHGVDPAAVPGLGDVFKRMQTS